MSFPFPRLYWASPSYWTLIYRSTTCSVFNLVMAQAPLYHFRYRETFCFQAAGVSRERFPVSPIRGAFQLVPEVVERTLWTCRY